MKRVKFDFSYYLPYKRSEMIHYGVERVYRLSKLAVLPDRYAEFLTKIFDSSMELFREEIEGKRLINLSFQGMVNIWGEACLFEHTKDGRNIGKDYRLNGYHGDIDLSENSRLNKEVKESISEKVIEFNRILNKELSRGRRFPFYHDKNYKNKTDFNFYMNTLYCKLDSTPNIKVKVSSDKRMTVRSYNKEKLFVVPSIHLKSDISGPPNLFPEMAVESLEKILLKFYKPIYVEYHNKIEVCTAGRMGEGWWFS